MEGGARLAGPAINPANARSIALAWEKSDPKLVVIDNLLTDEALAALRRFCLGSTVWKRPYANGYLGAMPDGGFAAPLLAQIAKNCAAPSPACSRIMGCANGGASNTIPAWRASGCMPTRRW